MGFNFGAFAAGAIKGAGDLVEKQHKETKDSIDSNMKFAYEQGLPFIDSVKKIYVGWKVMLLHYVIFN